MNDEELGFLPYCRRVGSKHSWVWESVEQSRLVGQRPTATQVYKCMLCGVRQRVSSTLGGDLLSG